MMGNAELLKGIERHLRLQRYKQAFVIFVMLGFVGLLCLKIWGWF